MKFWSVVLGLCFLGIQANFAFAVPNDPPVVNATYERVGITDVIEVTGSVTDENLASVSLSLDGPPITGGSLQLFPNGTFSFEISMPFGYSETIKITAYNGNSLSGSKTLFID